MIVGIGCDIVEHETSRDLKWESNFSILSRIFSSKEIDIYSSKKDIKFFSGRFAAKEAILKCLGTGMRDGISLIDIQILQSEENDKPIVELKGEPKKISDIMEVKLWHIGISHSNKYSMAFVLAEK